jgi:hypothetical protein
LCFFAEEKATHTVQIGNTTITALKKEDTINVGARDKAEGDERKCESDDEEIIDRGQPVKV